MNIKEAKQCITDTLRAYLTRDELGNYLIPAVRQRPVLLMGPPGVGKTQIMEQIAAEQGVGLVAYTITHHTRQSAIGLPVLEKRDYEGEAHTVTEYTMSEIIASVYELMKTTGLKEGILFLDEINCVSETLAPMMLQFLQCKTFGNQKLPEGWLIVAAGNPPEYNKSVRDFDVVTLDRVKRMDVEENYAVWREYALKKQLHSAVVTYLDIKKENFYRIENTADGLQFVTARGWEDLSEILYAYEKLGLDADKTLVEQYLQLPTVARDFANYLALYRKYRESYRVEEILAGKYSPLLEREFRSAPFDERLSVMGLLYARLAEGAKKIRRQDALTDALYEDLREVKAELGAQSAETVLKAQAETRRSELKRAAAAGGLEKEKRNLLQLEALRLEEYASKLAEHGGTAEEGFALLKESFSAEVDKREALAEACAALFENAFVFLERAAGEGQELVLFVTEITAGSDTSFFVENFGCEAYFRHNSELLLGDTRRRILDKISALD